jgi:hypothetical protein
MKTTKNGGKKNGNRYCHICSTKLQKNGMDCDSQRWRTTHTSSNNDKTIIMNGENFNK